MTCDPNQNTLDINPSPLPPVGGYGIPIAPTQISNPEFQIPPFLEDVTSFVEELGALFPSGTFRPLPEYSLKTVYDFVSNVLAQISPYLSLYSLFQAPLNLFSCIIEVLCSIPNIFAMIAALRKLFAVCIPDLIRMLPFAALPIMIISLLLLLLALITYIIQALTDIINDIIQNLTILETGIQLNDAKATEAAIEKVAVALCSIQNVIAIFSALSSIFSIIDTLSKLAGSLFCADGDNSSCCSEATCPSFIKNTPDGINTTSAQLRYFKQIGFDSSSLGLTPEQAAVFNVPPIRPETWQIWDLTNNPTYKISDIITPVPPDFNNFYPDETIYTKDTPLKQAPYSADVRIFINLQDFGLESNLIGAPPDSRYFRIKDCIVVKKPYLGVKNFDNSTDTSLAPNGTLCLEGGLVFEDDGTTPFLISGVQATLNNFIHQDASLSTILPSVDDSINFTSRVELTWKPNAPQLANLSLTTIGCVPEISLEKSVLNATLNTEGIEAFAAKLPAAPSGVQVPSTGVFPNISGTLDCLNAAIATFRTSISAATAAEFQAATTACLNDLTTQTSAVLCSALVAAVSKFQTTISLDTDLQFTSRPVVVSVDLKDMSNTPLGLNLTAECIPILEQKLEGTVTFGSISDFKYDGVRLFKAEITSEAQGGGSVTVSFDNNILSTYTPSSDTVSTPTIIEKTLSYNFISSFVNTPVRRDETDVSGST